MIKHAWNKEAEQGLSGTTDDMHRLRSRVLRGEAELWRVENQRATGWLVTEVFPDMLWVWVYQGVGFLQVVRTLARIGLDNGLERIGWFTHHRGPKRVFRFVRPTIELTEVAGEYRYTLNCEDLCALPTNRLIETLPSEQSADTTSTSGKTTARALLRLTRPRVRVVNWQDRSQIPTVAVISSEARSERQSH